ncbi:MAG: hypothetical protein CLLPBCKN_002285 [Chroococcidiopsis cubana SAG 39.79]|jgi:uncharacterized protein (TIGR02588 family)|uniref:TIGR02588 family protein n=2 Tax=Chroococcidiopsis TaxID=54298 RepID=K9TTF5_CHRTP|nr:MULTISPECIES: hypothetical protein [Chroococcidiopsis]PSB44341.1 hypothetical protein C7B80_20925 [Cyanosarcina cf. burmensis CCALA 770]AFY85693.1 hypothetical protein Chro_0137 [Chroococcidiopsis thermalis PCC 7203]MDZ4872889.1 hypothetical protein [Chroococcidiopsis cubana SAG 39.79]PSB61689.1 hypothetical protein C7B79_21015 [Chroococcidiopsis cubana CCALA 043]RUT12795.1 TIGR02588 family protein [Chroococcidiopsis cubana SAG 39.79]
MKKLEKNWLEWIVFGISLILVLFTLGYIVYDGATLGETPPNIELQLGQPQPQSDRFIVPVTATNRGDETAETVQIEVTLNSDGREEETAEFEIAFLPRHSTRRGWVTFQTDPRTVEQIEARVLGFEKP